MDSANIPPGSAAVRGEREGAVEVEVASSVQCGPQVVAESLGHAGGGGGGGGGEASGGDVQVRATEGAPTTDSSEPQKGSEVADDGMWISVVIPRAV